MMGSHWQWGLWGVAKAGEKLDIKFGYWRYALARLREYYRMKSERADAIAAAKSLSHQKSRL